MKITAMLAVTVLATCAHAACAQTPYTTFEHFDRTGNITIAYIKNSVPLSYADDTGKPAGFLVDVCQQIAQSLKKRSRNKTLDIVFSQENFQTRIGSLQQGRTDLDCTGLRDTPERRLQVEFSVPPLVAETRFLVTKEFLGGRDVKEALRGETVAAAAGTTNVQALRSFSSITGMSIRVSEEPSYADAIAKLAAGQVAAVVASDSILARHVAELPNPGEFVIAGEPIEIEPIAIAVRKSDAEIIAAVNQALRDMMASGELAKLYARAFGGRPVNTKPIMPLPANHSTLAAWKHPADRGYDSLQSSLTTEISAATAARSASRPPPAPVPQPVARDTPPPAPGSNGGGGFVSMLGAVAQGLAAAGGKNAAQLAAVGNAMQGRTSPGTTPGMASAPVEANRAGTRESSSYAGVTPSGVPSNTGSGGKSKDPFRYSDSVNQCVHVGQHPQFGASEQMTNTCPYAIEVTFCAEGIVARGDFQGKRVSDCSRHITGGKTLAAGQSDLLNFGQIGVRTSFVACRVPFYSPSNKLQWRVAEFDGACQANN